MKKGTVGIDIDGVLADTVPRWLAEMDRMFGIKAEKRDIKKYILEDNFDSVLKEDALAAFGNAWEDYKSIKLIEEGIPHVLNEINKTFNITITTANPSGRIRDWLAYMKIPYDGMVQFGSHTEKHALEGVSIYVDDNIEVIENVAKAEKTGILYKQPWNDAFAAANDNNKIKVVENWKQIQLFLLGL